MRIEDEIQSKNFTSPIHKAAVNLMFTASWYNARQNRILKPHGLSMQQYNVLRILRGRHPDASSINLLIDRMIDKQSNASRLVEKLRQKGLVERRICEDDRRKVDVRITDKGLYLLEELDDQMDEFIHNLLRVNEEQAEKLSNLLDEARGN